MNGVLAINWVHPISRQCLAVTGN